MTRIQWQSEELGSREDCELLEMPGGHRLAGVVLLALERRPLRLVYQVDVDEGWRTRTVNVALFTGAELRSLALASDGEGRWQAGGEPVPDLDGCTDIDLEWSPATNTLPIRRLGLAAGQSAGFDAAWVRFPSLRVERLTQRYNRLDERRWRYSSGSFEAQLDTDGNGLVLVYEGIWQAVAHSGSGVL